VNENNQKNQWDKTYQSTADFFGHEPSEFGMGAMRTFLANGAKKILELGCGRDATLYTSSDMASKSSHTIILKPA
jgi:hypothetical protein